MAYGRVAKFEPIREVAFGAIGAGYTAIGTLTTDYTRLVTFSNSTDQDVYISLDAIHNQLRVFRGSSKVFDISANKIRDDGLFLPKGTVFYIKQASGVPTTGLVAVEVMYAAGGV
jgi:hypothetical protein